MIESIQAVYNLLSTEQTILVIGFISGFVWFGLVPFKALLRNPLCRVFWGSFWGFIFAALSHFTWGYMPENCRFILPIVLFFSCAYHIIIYWNKVPEYYEIEVSCGDDDVV